MLESCAVHQDFREDNEIMQPMRDCDKVTKDFALNSVRIGGFFLHSLDDIA